jgi:sugar/nucleoside kinase (ribokinase family)
MKYHVYGIGNALVDKEFEVTDQFLQDNNIEKGMMSLLDEDAHITLLENLKKTFGLKKRASGGSAANSIVAISQFGGKTFYDCKVANDEQGDFYRKDLAEAGVTTRLKEIQNKGSTGKCMVMVTPDAERTMNTFLGVSADFSEKELHLEEMKQAEYLYIEGYVVTSDSSRAAAIKARKVASENHVKTAMTFSDPAMVTYFKEGIKEIFAEGVDILFCNEEECLTFTDKQNLDEAIKTLTPQVGKLVITLGKEGALVVNGDERMQITTTAVKAIDTNGAGDMFAGAFLYGITNGMSDRKAGLLASKAAARIVTTFGARLDKTVHHELLKEMLEQRS